MRKEGGMQVTPEEKKAWAENLLRQKCTELGRMPTKKDFDSATCAQIKAYLGPWPRALESAGLKQPKNRKDDLMCKHKPASQHVCELQTTPFHRREN